MKIVIMGDFHLQPENREMTYAAMKDVAEYAPDLLIPLGDFGTRENIGSVEGLQEARRFLEMPGVPVRPILGNHDLERESGRGIQKKGRMEQTLIRTFALPSSYGVLEYEGFRLFFVSSEPQPEDSCYCLQECYVTENQFAALVNELERRPGIPAIFFTHAPPVGSGIRTAPSHMHIKSTNAYLDQNHDPYRWLRLFQTYREIILWFSAHFHLGHQYPDSHTVRFGTHFFNTGVHGPCTRDRTRQSRILDITADRIKVLTLDHRKRMISQEGSFQYNGSPAALMEGNRPIFPSGNRRKPHKFHKLAACSVGEKPARPDGVIPVDRHRFIVCTQDGYSWEVDPEAEAVKGTLHFGSVLQSAAVDGRLFWMAWANSIGTTDLTDPWRFAREADTPWPMWKTSWHEPVLALTSHPEGGVWAATERYLYRFESSESVTRSMIPWLDLAERPGRIISEGDKLWILGKGGSLWSWRESGEQPDLYRKQDVTAFDAWQGQVAILLRAHGRAQVVLRSGKGSEYQRDLEEIGKSSGDGFCKMLCMGEDRLLILNQGEVYFWDAGDGTFTKIMSEEGEAVDIARVGDRFAILYTEHNRYRKPRFELYELMDSVTRPNLLSPDA